MSSFQVNSTLQQTRFSNIRWVSETGSTNADLVNLVSVSLDEAKNTAMVGSHTTPETVHATISVSEPVPYVLGADFQTAGRGRQGRGWIAPPTTSVLMSVALPLYGPNRIPQSNWSWLTPALSMAVLTATNELLHDGPLSGEISGVAHPAEVVLKWPNDVVVVDEHAPHGYKKVAGILAELIADPAYPWAVIGVGINTNWPEIPADLKETTTSVNHLRGQPIDRDDFVSRILVSLDTDWLPLLEAASSTDEHDSQSGIEQFRSQYLEHLLTVGQRVQVQTPQETFEAQAVGIALDGRLLVEDTTHGTQAISAADVVHLRPTKD